jgi:hypothetical protein
MVTPDGSAKLTSRRPGRELFPSSWFIVGDTPLAKAVLWRGYELQSEGLVHSYFEKYPDELPAWDASMDAATEQNLLEQRGVTLTAGVPEPERPPELGHTPVGDRA